MSNTLSISAASSPTTSLRPLPRSNRRSKATIVKSQKDNQRSNDKSEGGNQETLSGESQEKSKEEAKGELDDDEEDEECLICYDSLMVPGEK